MGSRDWGKGASRVEIGPLMTFFVYGIFCQSEVPEMSTRNVVLTPRQDELIDVLVKTGRYQNASEVLREGLRLVEQREAEDAAKLAALRDAARVGMADFESGRFKTFASADDMRKHLRARAAKVIAKTKRG